MDKAVNRGKPVPYKLAAIDLDETLLSPDLTISQENLDALKLLQSLGIKIVLASGRNHESMLRFQKQLAIENPLVSCNGAMVKNPQTGEILHSQPLGARLALSIVRHADRMGITAISCHHGGVFARTRNEWTAVYETFAGYAVQMFKGPTKLVSEDTLKILLLDKPKRIDMVRQTLPAYLIDSLYIVRTEERFLEFCSKDVNKAQGLRVVADSFGIKRSEILAFGDGNNDAPMLSWSAMGVAMDHATPAAKAAARLTSAPGPPETAFARAVGQVLKFESS